MYVFTTFEDVKTAADIKKYFEKELDSLYPLQEIESLFFVVLESILCRNRVQIRMEINTALSWFHVAEIEEVLSGLKGGKPVQYLLGETEFYRLPFKVNNSVLIPRQETEELVRWILNTLRNKAHLCPKVLDIGTGSGCIPIVIQKELPMAEVSGVDVSKKALVVARKNNELNKTNVKFEELNVLENDLTSYKKLDILVSNPPYVLENEKQLMHKNVLENEPYLALFVKNINPLLFYKRIAKLALEALNTGGYLFFEINEKFGQETVNLLASLDYKNIILKKDINGKNRMIRCEKG